MDPGALGGRLAQGGAGPLWPRRGTRGKSRPGLIVPEVSVPRRLDPVAAYLVTSAFRTCVCPPTTIW